jgi:hypothetical protein
VRKYPQVRSAAIFAFMIVSTTFIGRNACVRAPNCYGSDHKVKVVNKSGNTIWVTVLSTTQTGLPEPPTCASNSQCQANEFCDTIVNDRAEEPI